jgi:hypothetical protein
MQVPLPRASVVPPRYRFVYGEGAPLNPFSHKISFDTKKHTSVRNFERTMMYTKAFSLLLLATCVAAHTGTRKGEPVVRRRRMKKSDSNGKQGSSGNNGGGSNGADPGEARGDGFAYDDGSTLSAAGVKENHPCKPWLNTFVQAAATSVNDYGESSLQCNQGNECSSGGCCRVYNYLLCDADNDYPHMPCVCGATTFNHSITTPPVPIGTGVGQSETGTQAPEQNRTGTGTAEYPVNVGEINSPVVTTNPPVQTTVDEEICDSPYNGNDFGIHPTNASSLPDDLEPGDCRLDYHCQVDDNPNVCCKYLSKECKSFIIGAPHS